MVIITNICNKNTNNEVSVLKFKMAPVVTHCETTYMLSVAINNITQIDNLVNRLIYYLRPFKSSYKQVNNKCD